MMPSRGVTRIKLQRNSFRTDTLQPIKRKWTGSGLNPPADCEKQAQARETITNPNVVSQEQSKSWNKSWNPKTATYFNGCKQDELDDGQAGRNQDINSCKEAKRQLRSDLKKEKRLVKHSCCTLCSDSKINASANTKLLRLLCRRSRSCHSKHSGWQKVPPVYKCPEYKAITRFDKHPVVNLCDVGRVFKIASRDFSCVLPAVRTQMKCQKVQCLKKEFCVPEHSRLLQIRMRRSGESWEVSTSTNSSASFLSGGPSSTATSCKFLSCTVEPLSGCVKPSKTGDGGTSLVVHDNTQHSPEPHKPPLIIKRIILNQKSGLPPDEDNYKRNLEDWDAAPSVSEKFSCQRTQGYLFIPKASCARTYKVWPFPRRGPPNELRSESQSGPRWITNSLSANPETFLSASVAPECCSTPVVLAQPSVQTEPRMNFDQTSVDPPGSVDLPSVLPVELLEKCRESPEETFNMPSETRQELCVPAFEVQHTETEAQPPLRPCKKQIVKLKRRGKANSPKDCVHAPVELGSAGEGKAFPVKPERADNYDTNCLGDAASSQKSRLFTHDQNLLNGFTTPVDMLLVSESFTSIIPDSGVCSPASISQTRLKSRKLKSETPTRGFTLDSVTTSVALTTISDSSSSEGPKRQGNHDGLTSEGTSEQVRGLSSSEDEATKDRFTTAAQASETHTTADGFLDVSRAYHEDVLLLDVIQDDPDLFGEVATHVERVERTREEENDKRQKITETKLQKKNMSKIVWGTNTKRPSMTCLNARHEKKSLDGNLQIAEMPISKGQINPQVASTLGSEKLTDCNNKHELRNQLDLGLQELNSRATRVGMDKNNNGPSRSAMEAPGGRTLNNSYCRYYFNEFGVCRWDFCWYLHVPKDKDEKFCMEVLQKFCFFGSLPIVLRAVAVFQGYYSKCSPGLSYNQETVNHLLSCLLNFALLKEFREVVNLLLVHKRPPPPEIVLFVFELVMERGLVSAVPDLIHLASKVIEAGCVFSVVQCEIMQNHLQVMQVPRQHMDVFLAVKCRALASIPHTSVLAYNWVQAKTTVERLKLQEDWTGLAQFFCCVCEDHHSPPDFQRFCCIVTMALLKDLKDKLSLPYEQFAESVCQNATFNQQQKVMLGRIGVSLIFKFHKMREWNKGVKLVKVMVRLQIDFITLKGVMGNEQAVSRCQLVTEATELFLHSRNIEGALKMLQADDWFVSSDSWPCEQADLQNRRRVLTLLADKTSHRDTFEILTNMPGLRQTINGVHSSDYTHLFNNHLHLCVMKQTLLVAADVLEFMVAHGMIPESLHLQMLVYKLAKQNNWVRARTVFKRAQAAGFYSAVVCERDSLFLPCSLNEIEMTLAFEMFITSINSGSWSDGEAAQPLFITLKRQADVQDITESMYLAAGSRLLSAALIPNPKLGIRYISASPSQEQLFQLDRASALKWFVQNQRWAQTTWTS